MDNGNGKCSSLSNASAGDCRAMFNSTRSDFECHVHAGWSNQSYCLPAPADFWLWGYLKSRVYLSGPSSLRELKDVIRREVSSIHLDKLHSAVAGFVARLECLLPSGGGHVEDILV
ncbi:uncharacterized protein TNCV_1208741 [Trichonephila clavipes]|nr:uncharacterized protein TNCV_1208741 [Trichonephila clavipes]